MDYAGFLRAQAAAFVEQFFYPTGNRALIAVPDRDALTRRQTVEHGGQVVSVAGISPTDAMVWRDTKNRPELWVKAEEKAQHGTGFYARAWRAFVKQYAGVEATGSVGGVSLQVDHLYPETAAVRAGLFFVRTMAVNAVSNVRLGSTTEKLAAGGKLGTMGRPRSATFFTLAKVTGFQGSFGKKTSSADAARALTDFLRAQGYPLPAGAEGALDRALTEAELNRLRGDD